MKHFIFFIIAILMVVTNDISAHSILEAEDSGSIVVILDGKVSLVLDNIACMEDDTTQGELRVINSQGQIIEKIYFSGDSVTVSASNWANGVYQLVLTVGTCQEDVEFTK